MNDIEDLEKIDFSASLSSYVLEQQQRLQVAVGLCKLDHGAAVRAAVANLPPLDTGPAPEASIPSRWLSDPRHQDNLARAPEHHLTER